MAGIAVDDHDIILTLTLGLPSSVCDPIIISFDLTNPAKLTLDVVITRLLNEETHQTSSQSYPTAATPTINSSTNEALVVSPACQCPLNEITCFFCEKKKHYCDACHERKAWLSHKTSGGAHVAEGAFSAEDLWSNDDDDEAI
ncbi:hypothetical protein F5878DRAFT_702794 [Lentinula raphanica]|uniref:Uncharacterized protein n=1 Tax=Lentinula raphanica TaxID=153919 RepID=A0AA38UH93_9AGAR|nr:hypothetical protein F5878DRAFT_702794 [Lentinula raphanica]